MACMDQCSRYKAKKPSAGIGRYASGQKRCQICEIYMNWTGNNCPCCGSKLRGKPRALEYKDKYNIQKPFIEEQKNIIETEKQKDLAEEMARDAGEI